MAIPDNYIDKITKDGESRMISPAADKVRVENEHYEGDNLDDVLDEIADAIDEAGSGDGTVTGVKVGTTPYNPDSDGVVDLSTPFAGKVDKETGKSLMTAAEHTKLQNLPTADQLTQQLGQKANSSEVVKSISVNGTQQSKDSSGNVAINGLATTQELTQGLSGKQDILAFDDAPTDGSNKLVRSGGIKTYVDTKVANASQGQTIVTSVDKVAIVDGHNTNSILSAPSSRQMRIAAAHIDALAAKIDALIDDLAGIAFTENKTAKVGALDWSTPAVPQYTISLGDIDSSVTVKHGNDTVSQSFTTVEGEVKLLLSSSNKYIDQITIVDGGGNTVDVTKTNTANGTEITFVLRSNVTLNVTAAAGIAVNVSGANITSSTTYVRPNTEQAIIIPLPEHYHWDGDVVVMYGTSNITSQCDIEPTASGKSVTLPDTLDDTTKAVNITANAAEDAHAVLSISGSGYVVKQGSEELTNGSKIYNGSSSVTLSISPVSGKKFSSTPQYAIGSGSASNASGSSVYGAYTFEVSSSVADGTTVSVSATTEDVETFSIDSSGLGNNITIDDGNGNALSGNVLEGSTLVIRLTPDDGYRISEYTATMEDGGVAEDLPAPTNVNRVLTFTIAVVTGDIVIEADAEQVVEYGVHNRLLNTVTNNNADSIESGENYSATVMREEQSYRFKSTVFRIIVGSTDVTSQCSVTTIYDESDQTIEAGCSFSIPSSVINGDICIIAAAATGTVKITMTEAATIYFGNTQYQLTVGENTITGVYSIGLFGDSGKYGLDTWSSKTKITAIDFGGASISYLIKLFKGCSNLEEVKNLSVKAINAAGNEAFSGCSKLKSLDMSLWNIEAVTNMNAFFASCSDLASFTGPIRLNDTDGIDIGSMFNACGSLASVDLSLARLKVTSTNALFNNCSSLRTIYLHGLLGTVSNINFTFNGIPSSGSVVLAVGNLDVSQASSTTSNGFSRIKTLICASQTPPNKALLTYATGLTAIYVPDDAVSTYTAADGWAEKGAIIHSISDLS